MFGILSSIYGATFFLRNLFNSGIFRILVYSEFEEYAQPRNLWCNVFFNKPCYIYEEVFYSELFLTITCLDSWYIQHLSILELKTFKTPWIFKIQFTQNPFVCSSHNILRTRGIWIEPCVKLAYLKLEAYSEPWQISIIENFIQNHV